MNSDRIAAAISASSASQAALDGRIALHRAAAMNGDQRQITATRGDALAALEALLDTVELHQRLVREEIRRQMGGRGA